MIGDKIRYLRKANNMTQEDLAEHLHISTQAVSKWECGVSSPDISLVLPLTKLFGVSADELLGINDRLKSEKREKYDSAYREYYGSDNHGMSYWWAKEALTEYPEDFGYMDWLAEAEYRLAFDENKKSDASLEYFEELMENSLRRYETIIANSSDPNLIARATLGKIVDLRFLGRTDEAEWSAEFEYPDKNIHSVEEVLLLSEKGKQLLKLLLEEADPAN